MVKTPSPWTALAREFCVEADFDWHDAAECPMCSTLVRFAERVAQQQRAQDEKQYQMIPRHTCQSAVDTE